MYTIIDYKVALDELQNIGLSLMDNVATEEWWYDEVETMDMHLEVCKRILRKAQHKTIKLKVRK